MTPYEQAAQVYEQEESARPFWEDLQAHLLYGWVMSTPELFLMARQVKRDWPDELLKNPWAIDDDGDCWHVWLAAGDLSKVKEFIPYPLPYLSYERVNVLRSMPFDKACRRIFK